MQTGGFLAKLRRRRKSGVSIPARQVSDFGIDSAAASDHNPFGYRKLNLVIHGFFDDSGKESDKGNQIVCMAGYLAVDQLWNMFTEGGTNF
jgi:hypothetical protein